MEPSFLSCCTLTDINSISIYTMLIALCCLYFSSFDGKGEVSFELLLKEWVLQGLEGLNTFYRVCLQALGY